jgi:hypothetical protein
MTTRGSIANLLVVACFLLITAGGPYRLDATSDIGIVPAADTTVVPARGTTVEWQYTMTARVRPLLFWISRSGVGGGRISWVESPDGTRSLELLIGSDPTRTPMKINRWGYVAERVAGSSAELVGVMTESEEQSIEQAAARKSQAKGAHAFKAIRGRLDQGLAQSTVIRLLLAEDFTYREADSLLRQLPARGPSVRQMQVPNGAEPGFLFALMGMMHDSVEKYLKSGTVSSGPQTRRTYVYDASLYEIVAKSSRFLKTALIDGLEYPAVINSQFETRNTRTGIISKFSVAYGTQGPHREIPLAIVYQPRWWLEAELQLDHAAGAAGRAAGKEMPWNPFNH